MRKEHFHCFVLNVFLLLSCHCIVLSILKKIKIPLNRLLRLPLSEKDFIYSLKRAEFDRDDRVEYLLNLTKAVSNKAVQRDFTHKTIPMCLFLSTGTLYLLSICCLQQ